MEAHGLSIDNIADTVKAHMFLTTDRAHVLREILMAVRKGGTVSIPGVYGGLTDKFPIGALMQKALTVRTGQTHVHRYKEQLLALIEEGKIDTTFLISHHASLEQAPEMYRHWHDDQDTYTKIVLKTDAAAVPRKDKQAKQGELA
jgi:threonine dehydrogenase-like Zn-dependent dehydrogenase